jgi:hypothetical protein
MHRHQPDRPVRREPAPHPAAEASAFRRDVALIAAGFLGIVALGRVILAALAG